MAKYQATFLQPMFYDVVVEAESPEAAQAILKKYCRESFRLLLKSQDFESMEVYESEWIDDDLLNFEPIKD